MSKQTDTEIEVAEIDEARQKDLRRGVLGEEPESEGTRA